MPRHGFHDKVIMAPRGFERFPGKAEDDGHVNPVFVHGRKNVLNPGQPGFGGFVETPEGRLFIEKPFPVIPDCAGKKVCVKIDDHFFSFQAGKRLRRAMTA
jgi:hypothetical protein